MDRTPLCSAPCAVRATGTLGGKPSSRGVPRRHHSAWCIVVKKHGRAVRMSINVASHLTPCAVRTAGSSRGQHLLGGSPAGTNTHGRGGLAYTEAT